MSHSYGSRLSLALISVAFLGGCAHLVVLHDALSPNEHNDLGVVYESRGELDLAAKEYRRALRLDSHNARARVNLGNIEAAGADWKSAEKHYRLALRDSSTSYDAMNNLAIALVRQHKRLDEALALAERASASGGQRDTVYRATLAEVRAGRR
ncbi:MAG: tetratricopeptide repeat protein [Candidatus Eisenbacteria bacterium]